MAEATTLHDAFIDELRDTYDAERQLTKALPKLAKAASSPELRDGFESHLEETRDQIERLESVFESLDEKVRGKHCDGIAGIIEEGAAIMQEDFDETTMDACLIAAGQRAEHYEIAAYGTLVAWARAMGHDEAADTLQERSTKKRRRTRSCRRWPRAASIRKRPNMAHPRTRGRGSTGAPRCQGGRGAGSASAEERRRPRTAECGPRAARRAVWTRRFGATAEKPFDFRHQLVGITRLHDHGIHDHVLRLRQRLGMRIAGCHDQRNVAGVFALPQGLGHVEPRHPGQLQVHHNQVWPPLHGLGQGRHPVSGGMHLEPGGTQEEPPGLERVDVVIDNQNAGRCVHWVS